MLKQQAYKTPVVLWKSQWIIIKNEYDYITDYKTKKQISVPRQLLVAIPNKEYFNRGK